MQLTNAQVLNVFRGLNTLSQKTLPVKLSWRIATAIRTLEPFAKSLDESLKEIRVRYAIKDESGNFVPAQDRDGTSIPDTIQIPQNKLSVVNAEMDELLNEHVEIHNVSLNLSDFPDTLELEPAVLNGLLPIINDELADK